MRTIEWGHVTLGEVPVEVVEGGNGPPLVYLHGGYPSVRPGPDSPFLEAMAARFSITAPTTPGFGPTPAPDWLTTVEDLAFLYLDLLVSRDLRGVTMVGSSLGGWIVSTIASMSCERIDRLVLVDPVGIKISDRRTRDLVDIFATTDSELADAAFADSTVWPPDFSRMDDADVLLHARSREATARYGWSPYLHNPKLLRRLARIDVPALVIHGDADGICAPGYARAYAGAMPIGEFTTLTGAGHFPHLDAPNALATAVVAFTDRTPVERSATGS